MNKIFILFYFLITLLSNAQQKISRVELYGIERTNISFIEKFIQLKAGKPFDSLMVIEDVQTLRNLRVFSNVSYDIISNGDDIKVTYYLEEATMLLPLINFGSIKQNIWFQLGVADFNFGGEGITLGGYYRYYDRHSFEIFQKTPCLFSTRFGLSARAAKFSTLEPAYFINGTSYYNIDRFAIGGLLRYDFTPELGRETNYILELGGEYLYEEYDKSTKSYNLNSHGPNFDKHNKVIIKSILGGCVIHENFDGNPSLAFHRKSFSVYNPQLKLWQQTWVDN